VGLPLNEAVQEDIIVQVIDGLQAATLEQGTFKNVARGVSSFASSVRVVIDIDSF